MDGNPQPLGNGFLKIPHEFVDRIDERIQPKERVNVKALTVSFLRLCERQRRLHGGEQRFIFEAQLEDIGAEAAMTRNRVSRLLGLMELAGLIERENLRSATRIKLLFADPPQEEDAPLPHDETKKETRVKRSAAGKVTEEDIEEMKQCYGPLGVDVRTEAVLAEKWVADRNRRFTKRFFRDTWLKNAVRDAASKKKSPREAMQAARDAGEFTGERLCPDFDPASLMED